MERKQNIMILSLLYGLVVLSTSIAQLTFFDLSYNTRGLLVSVGIIILGATGMTYAIKREIIHFNKNVGIKNMLFRDKDRQKVQMRFENLRNEQEEKMLQITDQKEELLTLEVQLKNMQKVSSSIEAEVKSLNEKKEYSIHFFDALANLLPQRIWITDAHGQILFINKAFKSNLSKGKKINNLMDFLEISENQMDIFNKRNFGSILYRFKEDSGNVALEGKSIRIFENETVKYILYTSKSTDFEKKMNQNYLRKSRDLHVINEIGKIIIGRSTISGTLQEALDKIAFLNNLNSTTIRLLNNNNELEIKALSGYSKQFILKSKVEAELSHMGYAYNENRMIFINKPEDLLFNDPDVENVVRKGGKIAYIPLANYKKTFGIMSIVSDNEFNTENLTLFEAISINLTIALEKILLYDQLKSNYFKTVEAFVTASEINSEWFSGHSRRVAEICRAIAEKLYLNEHEVDEIYMAGLLHDVGKLSSDHEDDYNNEDIHHHSRIGRRMIEKVGLSSDVLDGIEYHHLDYDLSNNTDPDLSEQPYYAQIIRIANDLDWLLNTEIKIDTMESALDSLKEKSNTTYSGQFLKILGAILNETGNIIQSVYQ
ncbi:MAG: HD domain-containing protein [Clostridiales bacterium]|nr:HD domain-containing protein [Clostridiales bacterium]